MPSIATKKLRRVVSVQEEISNRPFLQFLVAILSDVQKKIGELIKTKAVVAIIVM